MLPARQHLCLRRPHSIVRRCIGHAQSRSTGNPRSQKWDRVEEDRKGCQEPESGEVGSG